MSWIAVGAIAGGAAGFLGGSKGKKASFDPYGALNPEQRETVRSLNPLIQNYGYGTSYGGQLTAEMSPEEAAYYNPTRAGLLSGTIDQMMQEGSDQNAFNNRFNAEVATPTYQNFNQNELPGILEGYTGFSTAAGNARAQALNTIGNNLLTQRFTGQEAAKNRALAAYGAVPTAQSYFAAPRVFQQAGLDRSYNEYVRGNEQRAQNIDKALSFLGISTGTYTPAQKDTRFSGMFQGALMGGMMGGMMPAGGAAGGAGGAGANPMLDPAGFILG